MASHLRFISADEVKSVLTYEALIPAMETALARFSDRQNGGVVQPVRSCAAIDKYNGMFGVMPAFSELDDVLAAKLVCFYPNNKEVPTHNALIVMMEPQSGLPLAVMDGEVITAMRTAAVSAAVTKHLAMKDPKILALVGAGVQAFTHYQALSTLYNFSEVRISSRTQASAEKLAAKVTNSKVCGSFEEAVKGADIIVTVTSSPTPILKANWIKPGAHINAVGACKPTWQELESELIQSSVLYVDSQDAAMVESGDVILSKAEIFAEVGEVFLGKKEAYCDKTTVFKSLGLAVEDAVSAKLVYDKVSGFGGQTVST